MARRPIPAPTRPASPLTEIGAAQFGVELKKQFDKHIEQAEKTLSEWKDRLNVNPASAFDWAQDALTAAARWEVYQGLRSFTNDFIDKNTDATADLLASVLREVTNDRFWRHASDQCSSTSPMSNEMGRNRRLAWARVGDKSLGSLDYLIDRAHRACVAL